MKYFFADDGEKIHLQISGEGSPLVLLHGWTASHREWLPFLDRLIPHHHVFRWDARGHGGYPLSTQTVPSVQRMARDLSNLLEHYHLHDAVVVGHSLGALTLWEYIKTCGCQRLSKICLLDQSPKLLTDDDWPYGIYGHFDAQQAAKLESDLHDDFAEAILRLAAMGLNARARQKYEEHAPGLVKAREWLKAQYPPPLIACWQTLLNTDFRPALERIDIPVLLIYGGASNYYPPETGPYLHSRLRQSELHVYEGADHSPHQCDRDRFVHDLLRFMESGH